MSLFGDLKKVFFGAKSVAKHQAQKAGEAAKETFNDLAEEVSEKGGDLLADAQEKLGEATESATAFLKENTADLRERGSELAEQGKEALSDLGDKVFKETESLVDKGAELKDKGSDWINERLGNLNTSNENSTADVEARVKGATENVTKPSAAAPIDYEAGLTDTTPKAPSAAREAADNALDTAAKAGLEAKAAAEKLGSKIMDASEVVGDKVLEKGSELMDRAAEVGADLKSKANDFIDHANVEAEKMKLEDSIEEAKIAAEQAEARARAFGNNESSKDTSESLLDGTGSFFDRAAKFADGDYHREGTVRVVKNDAPDSGDTGGVDNKNITGFNDVDGDGDALIDDAQVEEE